jgi:hypothetical protein
MPAYDRESAPTIDQPLTVDLVSHSFSHRRLLSAVHRSPLRLYGESPDLARAIARYASSYLPMLAGWSGNAPPQPPSLDVAWVWHLHKLDPVGYDIDCNRAFGCTVDCAPGQDPFAYCAPGPEAHDEQALSSDNMNQIKDAESPGFAFSTDIAASAERQAVFLWQVRWGVYNDDAWLQEAERRYKMMLNLVRECPGNFIVPTYDIDLMWHTHMAFPVEYRRDCLRVAGREVAHDDSVNDRSEGSKLTLSAAETRILWSSLYHVPWARADGMWRGDPPGWYFESREIGADLNGAIEALDSRSAATAEAAVTAAAVEAARIPSSLKTGGVCTTPATALSSMLITGAAFGEQAALEVPRAITVPEWGHFAPVPAKSPERRDEISYVGEVKHIPPPPGRAPHPDLRYFALTCAPAPSPTPLPPQT